MPQKHTGFWGISFGCAVQAAWDLRLIERFAKPEYVQR
ncbi:Uncharacterised protein [Alcaligenes faecalis subsp. faecalis]|nr:Uncharacterised protein [Alcaligenes faecalis subsp. faecalis]